MKNSFWLTDYTLETPSHRLAVFTAKVKEILLTFRFFNTRSMILFYLLGLKSADLPLFTFNSLLMLMVFFSLYGYLSLTNYIFDRKVDLINRSKNPINSGLLTELQSIVLSVIFVIIATILAGLTGNIINILFVFSLVFIGYFYSCPPWRWSQVGIPKFLMMLIVYTILPFLTAILPVAINLNAVIFLIFLSFFYGSFMLYSDVKDMAGDKKEGKNTLAVTLGISGLALLSLTLSSLSFVGVVWISLRTASYPIIAVLMLLILNLLQQIVFRKPLLLLEVRIRHIGGYFLLATLLAFVALL